MTAVGADWAAAVAASRSAAPQMALAEHHRLARSIAGWRSAGALPSTVQPFRLAVLRSVTAEVLAASLTARLAELDLAAEVELGQLGAIGPETLADDSFVYRGRFDAAFVLATAEQVFADAGDPLAGPDDAAVDEFLAQVRRLAERLTGLVIVANFVLSPRRLAPQWQAQSAASGRYAIARANLKLAHLADELPNLAICDLESAAARLGAAQFFNERDWQSSMQPFSPAGVVAVADELARAVRLRLGSPIKCIVLDCDNTLWGGVIGEDGLDGIRLGESYPGVCFQRFQRQLVQLGRMGFLLAINSKNNEPDVRAVFDRHPAMALRPAHLAAQRINWQDKAANLRELADELNIGLDAMLFIDDSDFEINLVRQQLPQVRCLQVPAEPWKLPALLADCPLLDRLRLSREDREKSQAYAAERQRREFRNEAGDLAGYLRGLDIRLRFEPFDRSLHLTRAAQLTQKTNQYNLTTRRYSEADLLTKAAAGAHIWLASLSDRFGDYGRIALAIVEPTGPRSARLDTLLMSCRVIGRGVEDAFLRLVLGELSRAGVETLAAQYRPTERNGVCRDLLPSNGFRPTAGEGGEAGDDEGQRYLCRLSGAVASVPDWITLV